MGVLTHLTDFLCHSVSINDAGNSFGDLLDMVRVQNIEKFGS